MPGESEKTHKLTREDNTFKKGESYIKEKIHIKQQPFKDTFTVKRYGRRLLIQINE